MFRGRFIPAMRAISPSPLTLLVALVLADHQHHTVAADDLAFLAHRLDRRSYLHDPFQRLVPATRLWLPPGPPLPIVDMPPRTPAASAKAGLRMLASSASARDALDRRLARLSRARAVRALAGLAGLAVRPSLARRGRVRPGGAAARGRRQMPRRQHARALRGDRDRELEVRGRRAVLRVDRPAVAARAHAGAPRGRHRLDRQHHALFQQRALARLAVVGHLRILVHAAPHAVADERAYDREARALD